LLVEWIYFNLNLPPVLFCYGSSGPLFGQVESLNPNCPGFAVDYNSSIARTHHTHRRMAMNQIQINVIQLHIVSGNFQSFSCACIAICSEFQSFVVTNNLSLATPLFLMPCNRLFILVRSSRVNVAISRLNSLNHASFNSL